MLPVSHKRGDQIGNIVRAAVEQIEMAFDSVGGINGPALLNPNSELFDRCAYGQLIHVELVEQGGKRITVGHG